MYAAVIREGDVVRLPSGRLGLVDGYAAGTVSGTYLGSDEPWQLTPRLLRFVSGKIAGPIITEVLCPSQ